MRVVIISLLYFYIIYLYIDYNCNERERLLLIKYEEAMLQHETMEAVRQLPMRSKEKWTLPEDYPQE